MGSTTFKKIARMALVLGIFAIATAIPNNGPLLAQESEEVPAIYFEHTPASEDLPDPGLPMKLVVRLTNTDEFSRRMRMIANIDGQVSDIPVTTSYLNRFDHPEYSVEIFAPRHQISYQFFLELTPGGIQIPSPRYSMKRDCLPEVLDVDPNAKIEEQGTDKLNILNRQAASLQREIGVYDNILRVLTRLREEMGNNGKEE